MFAFIAENWSAGQKWFVILSIPVLLSLLIMNIVPAALAFTVLAGIYVLFDIVTIPQFLQSFTSMGLITLILLLLCSLAVERSLLVHYFTRKLFTDNERMSFIRLISASSILSAFINNTAVVAAFLGSVVRQKHIAPSRLLIPLSFATIFGGITTLVGTSTNLVVNTFVVDAGLPPLNMFTFTIVGLPTALICLSALYFLRHRLPSNRAVHSEEEASTYFLTAEVGEHSDLIGKTIRSSGLGRLDKLSLLEIVRNGRLISPVVKNEIILAGDHLVFTGSVGDVQALQPYTDLHLIGGNASELLKSNLVEVLISNESELLYNTLAAVDFTSRFNAAVIGIRRGDKRLTGRLDHIPLRTGDALLLAVGDTFFHQRTNDRNFHIIDGSRHNGQSVLPKNKSIFVVIAFIAAILASALEILPFFKCLLLLLAAYLFTGCIQLSDLRRRFPFDLFMVIGSALVVSKGMESTGAATLLSEAVMAISPDNSAYISMILIFFCVFALTEIITSNAAAALVLPFALQTASHLGVSHMPFVMSVALGASACFILPFGYQTHLMVYAPGNYRVTDYLRIGWPLSLCYFLCVIILVPLAFPF